jgi:hypothetical protein
MIMKQSSKASQYTHIMDFFRIDKIIDSFYDYDG